MLTIGKCFMPLKFKLCKMNWNRWTRHHLRRGLHY
jgi:hypothetical protein